MAFSNVSLGIVHSMAHKIGGVFHVPHGCANAILLPSVIEFNAKKTGARFAKIALMLGLEGKEEKELVESLVKLIRDLNNELNIPKTFKEYGIDEGEFLANIKYMSDNAVKDVLHTNKSKRS